MVQRPLCHPRTPSQPVAFLPMKERKIRESASRPCSALGCWRRPRWPPPYLTSTLVLAGQSSRWVLRDCRQLPVTAKTAAASSGQLANNTNMAVHPASHGKRQCWPHVQCPTANSSVVAHSTSHGELQFGLTSNIPWQTSMWPHVQHPMVNTSVASRLTSHSKHQRGLTSKVPQQRQAWLCVQYPHVACHHHPSIRSKPTEIHRWPKARRT